LARGTIILAALAAAAIGLAACGGDEATSSDAKEPAREVAAVPGAAPADGPTLRAVRARGRLTCGVAENRPGFATRDVLGWRGFDVDFCRAVAAAVFGDARQVRIVPLTPNDRFTQLQAGEIDLIPRAALSLTRDAGFGVDFVGISFHDDQRFLVPRSMNARSPADLAGRTVCVEAASSFELNLADYAETLKAKPKATPLETEELAVDAYAQRRCEALTGDFASLSAIRSDLRNPDDHVILDGPIAKDPEGPYVRQGDSQWADIVRWTLNAMILAEEHAVTSRTVADDRRAPKTAEVGRLLTGDPFGQYLLLEPDWAYQVIRQVGNYGEVYARHIGPESDLGMERGKNALWNAEEPGLLYAPPIR
jgi:general L-amino acid transport system substrate-binding protein